MSRVRHYLLAVQTLLSLSVGWVAAYSVQAHETDPRIVRPSVCQPVKLKSKSLPNLVRVHEHVISGGLPDGDAAFRELKDLGVKTIISVDGMTPDVETARKYGLKYVHLPHGYDGIPKTRVMELAKAVREFKGPIYIHCHHGQHRSPAAASTACVTAGLITNATALSILKLAGTSPNYKGLSESVRQATPCDPDTLGQLRVTFKEVQEIPPLVEAMVELNRALENLKLLSASRWIAPSKHPDLDPAHQALLIREIYTELRRTPNSMQADDFRQWLKDAETTADNLESAIRKWERRGNNQPPEKLSKLLRLIESNCKTCHTKYRDGPLAQKIGNYSSAID